MWLLGAMSGDEDHSCPELKDAGKMPGSVFSELQRQYFVVFCDALSGLIWPLRPSADPGWRLLSGENSLLAHSKIPSNTHLHTRGSILSIQLQTEHDKMQCRNRKVHLCFIKGLQPLLYSIFGVRL